VSARQLRDEVVVADHPVLGQRVAYLLPVVPEDAPHAVREGVARRRIAATTGRCPCGATTDFGERRPGEVGVGEVYHRRSCPATTARLVEACRRWGR